MTDSEPKSSPPDAWRRVWGKRAIGLLVALALTELGAALVYAAASGQWFSYEAMRTRRAQLVATAAGEVAVDPDAPQLPNHAVRAELSEQALHPYVGFLNDPTGDPWASTPPYAHSAQLFERTDALVVLVVGGSVAGQVRDLGREALTSGMARGPFEGREIVTVSLAVGGYKQPQQLSLVAYLLSVGARFDVLINIDGFNEAVLPWVENASAGTFPLYPRWWDLRMIGVEESATIGEIGAIRMYRDVRRDAARTLERSMWRYTVSANVAWHALDQWAEGRVYEHTRRLERHREQRSYQRSGPSSELDREQTLRLVAENWAQSSILLDRLSERSDFLYVHILQPNQYLEGRKPLSDEERRLFYQPDAPYGSTAPDGYAQLFAESRRLREAGVHFHDLTPIFEDDARTLYEDDCCHFNQVGVDLLATRIGELVAEDAVAED